MYFTALRAIVPPNLAAFKRLARVVLDAPFCVSGNDARPYGKDNVWHICTDGWPGREIVVYSGGVGKDISTELELLDAFSCRVFIYDPSPTGQETMRNSRNQHERLTYEPLGLAGRAGAQVFSQPQHAEEGSFRKQTSEENAIHFACVRLSEQASQHGHREIDLVKLDIEGFEYEVLDDLLHSGIVVHQLCVEFHHFLPGHTARQTSRAVSMLRGAGFRIVYKRGADFTFLRDR
jgi:FkbM family methyltransferase